MGCLLISSQHMETLIDKVIEDAQNGMGSKLYDLASVLECIAEAQNDPVLHVLPQAIGGFGGLLVTSRQLIAIPVLPESMRTHLTSTINTAVSETTKALTAIKEELCLKDNPDHKILMNAIGEIYKHATILAKETRAMSRRQSSSQMSMDE